MKPRMLLAAIAGGMSGIAVFEVTGAGLVATPSSVMLASTVRKQLAGTPISVEHTPVDRIPDDADVVLCHSGLADRARKTVPGRVVVPFQLFIADPAVTRVVAALRAGGSIDG